MLVENIKRIWVENMVYFQSLGTYPFMDTYLYSSVFLAQSSTLSISLFYLTEKWGNCVNIMTFKEFTLTFPPKDQPHQFAADGNSCGRHAGNGWVHPLLYPHVHCQLQQQSGKGVF